MQASGHYHYTIIRQPKKKLAPGLNCEATLHVKEVMSEDKRSDILGRETSSSCFAVC